MLTKLIQLSQSNLNFVGSTSLGRLGKRTPCLDIHAQKNPTYYKHMNTKRLQDHKSTSLLRIRLDFNSKRALDRITMHSPVVTGRRQNTWVNMWTG